MGFWRKAKSEHAGDKGSMRKSGYWGLRIEAKQASRRIRRRNDRRLVAEQLNDLTLDEAVIDQAGRRLLEAAPSGTRLVLFGPWAHGHAGRHSDIEFLVIEPNVEDTADEAVRLRRALWGMRRAFKIVAISEAEVRRWENVRGSFIHAALRDGREITT